MMWEKYKARRRLLSIVVIILGITVGGMLSACAKPETADSGPAGSALPGSGTSAAGLPEKPPAITITLAHGHETSGGVTRKPLAYEILPNKWNGAVYDRAGYRDVLFAKMDAGAINTGVLGDDIILDFGTIRPGTVKIAADLYTDRSYAEPLAMEEVALDQDRFRLVPTYAGLNNTAFFVVTAAWDDNNEAEYVFVIRIEESREDPSLLKQFIVTEKGEVHAAYRIKEQGGKQILPYEFEAFMTHYAMISAQKGGQWQLYDYEGRRLTQDNWDDIIKTTTPMDNEVNGLVRVCKNGVWGCVDQQGKIVITPNWDALDLNYYEEVEPFLRVMKDGKYGYLTYQGKLVLEAEWDMAVMDVYNEPQDLIFVRRGDEWGTVKVVNNLAGEVDWTRKPSEGFQFGFMNERYGSQAQTMHDLIDSSDKLMMSSHYHFFYDYYLKNSPELRYLPDFNSGKEPDWDQLTKFVYVRSLTLRTADTGQVRETLKAEEFDQVAGKYFSGITYQHRPSAWLNFAGGIYTPAVNWSDSGFLRYYLNGLERTEQADGSYRFKAKLIGYEFWEEDLAEGSGSPNIEAVKQEARKLRYQGKTLPDVLHEIMQGDPTEILRPAVEQTIEFTVHNPTADVWLKYLSSERKKI